MSKFIHIKYRICWTDNGVFAPREVDGFAFEIPGWPEFHCCVRWGNRLWENSVFNDWLIDQYETGRAISEAGYPQCKEDAPEIMRKLLDSKGKDVIREVMRRSGLIAFENPREAPVAPGMMSEAENRSGLADRERTASRGKPDLSNEDEAEGYALAVQEGAFWSRL